MKRRQYIILGSISVIMLLIIMSLFGGEKSEGPRKAQQTSNVKYVKTQLVENASHPIVIKGHGRIGSSQNVALIAEVQGELQSGSIELKSGAQFTKGQLLFSIDDKEARLKMQARKSGFLTLLATSLPDLRIDYPDEFQKWEKFFEAIDVTKPLPELPSPGSVQSKTFLASKNILGEYYSIQADEELLSKYKVYAPFNGNFVEVFTELGTVVNPGSQIARIIHTGSLEVEVPLTVEEIKYLEVGNPVKINSKDKSQEYPGKIVRLGKYVNPNTQSVDVFIEVDKSASSSIYDGMYVAVEIEAGQLENVTKVSRKAVGSDDKIFVIQDSFMVSVPAVISLMDDENVYLSNMQNGIEMVVELPSNPVDSMQVKTLLQNE